MKKNCGFERITSAKDDLTPMPIRKTKFSAGYDFTITEDIVIPSFFKNMANTVVQRYTDKDFKKKMLDPRIALSLAKITSGELTAKNLGKEVGILLPELLLHRSISFSGLKDLVKESKAKLTLVPTNIKAFMEDDQSLELYVRSSVPLNTHIVLGNGVGLVDADYYNNESNEGHIYFQLMNLSFFDVTLKKGDIIGQGVFRTYDITKNDSQDDSQATKRIGGMGSTNGGKG